MNRAVNTGARFRRLFDGVCPALRRYARYRGLRGADADDLVADVLRGGMAPPGRRAH